MAKSFPATPNDVLCATFRYAGLHKMSDDTRKIHKSFYRVKQQHPRLFKEFTFRTDDVFPYSKELGSSLRDLETARILCVLNPDYAVYEITDSSVKYIDRRVIPKFSSAQKRELRKAGRLLRSLYRAS